MIRTRSAVAIGLSGAAAEMLASGWAGAGLMATRQELGLFLIWRPAALAVLAVILAGSGWRVRLAAYAAMLTAATLLERAAMRSGELIDIGRAVLAGGGAALLFDLVAQAGRTIGGRWLAGCAVALLLVIPGAGAMFQRLTAPGGIPQATRQVVAIATGLPLRWADGDGLATAVPSATWQLLAQAFDARPTDRIEAAPADRWLLIQPRAPSPQALVAMDARIRAGARAAILTDPDLRWPSSRALNDPSGPPRGATLDPLLRHWGLALERDGAGIIWRDLWWMGSRWRLALFAPGRFVASGGSPCRIVARGLLADCLVGDGRAILIADADLLHPQLWSEGEGGGAPAFRASDNAAFVIATMAGLDRIMPPVRPVRWRAALPGPTTNHAGQERENTSP